MNEVTETRRIEASPDAIRDAMVDVEAFVESAGFDDVEVDGETIRVANQVGIAELELELVAVEREGADVAHEQRDGIFEEMWTTYTVEPRAGGDEVDVTAHTEFTLDVPVVGDILDATVIQRQRRKELNAQLDWLEGETRR
ncbi:SRPBCC family protein [Halobacterium sp. KA-4]|jgi:carbon monoxide dehydrogenase subunit G|uniref:SRPBCC family protein n=1 Tax=Halobacterium sp. KA-4 TaxID=2896367 RepID=UPI001E334710|nr:SRPBCC family protein [Halobacterium sp. KA-4]MCD2199341.1 SRPBCC family protein [Halobacterium sp. KA-4]